MIGHARIAYFSMEIGLESAMPTYAGGLGMLAGDTLRSAADLGVPMIGVTLLHRRGYFLQELDAEGRQSERMESWAAEEFLEELPERVTIMIEGRPVFVRAWQRDVVGTSGFEIPVLFLDTNLPENNAADRALTDNLYGGDSRYRLCQEVVLGIGGVRMLRSLGCADIIRFHLNEGHASLLTAELLREYLSGKGRPGIDDTAIDAVRQQCVFTTHTPVPAGHDRFPLDLARKILGDDIVFERRGLFDHDGLLNMTYVALNLSHYVNGVAKRHGEVSREMFDKFPIDSITNGIHVDTWTCPAFRTLFDHHIPGWRSDNLSLRFGLNIPSPAVWEAHAHAKRELIEHVNRRQGAEMDSDVFTIGFARRATGYKRPDLFFADRDRLQSIAKSAGPIQVIYAGKAHPNDHHGKELIQQIHAAMASVNDRIRSAYLANYDMNLARLLTAGSDVWLNTPEPPFEASGTSGMKAAVNAVPSLSVLDGWWLEGCIENVTGWAIDNGEEDQDDAQVLYDKLENVILPMYYQERDRFISVMKHAMAVNGSFFNTERMVREYVVKAYLSGAGPSLLLDPKVTSQAAP